jgi:D-proline reductase (dithiol) PrdB
VQLRLADLLASPEDTPFNRLKYLARQPDADVARFLNELYRAAAVAHESGDFDPVDRLLDGWEVELSRHERIWASGPQRRWLTYETAPWTPFTKPLTQARIAVLTTGGVYVEGQPPFDAAGGDWSFREVHRDTPRERLRIAHEHYDLTGVREDPNCVFPLDRLVDLEREGWIGRVADRTYTFMGWIPDPSGLVQETAPEAGRRLKADGVDGVVIGTT